MKDNNRTLSAVFFCAGLWLDGPVHAHGPDKYGAGKFPHAGGF